MIDLLKELVLGFSFKNYLFIDNLLLLLIFKLLLDLDNLFLSSLDCFGLLLKFIHSLRLLFEFELLDVD